MQVGYTGSSTGGGGGGVGLNGRASISMTTSLIANGTLARLTITGYKTYVLSKVVTSAPCWVRIYTDQSSQFSDTGRETGNDPLPGSGVIAEVITTPGFLTQLITPGVIGFNSESSPNSNIYLNVTNYSGSSQAITVTLTLLQLEA
jgi:hypothetical protein